MTMMPITNETLRLAVDNYARTFGHTVPDAIVAMFATRPGALVFEIQDAVRRAQPVPGWHAHAKRTAGALRTA